MEISEAKQIISALADGTDPFTGEKFAPEYVCNNAETVRALNKAKELLEREEAFLSLKSRSKRGFRNTAAKNTDTKRPPNAGRKWTQEQDELLFALYAQGVKLSEMCRIIGRTRKGIAARLVRLGVIRERKELYFSDFDDE